MENENKNIENQDSNKPETKSNISENANGISNQQSDIPIESPHSTENITNQDISSVVDKEKTSIENKEDSSKDVELKSEVKTPEPQLSEEEKLKRQNNDLNDKYLRLYSEFENFRRRTIKERYDIIDSAGQNILLSLLPVVDDLERAISSIEITNDLNTVKEGITLVHKKFKNILLQKGLKEMNSMDELFNADLHDAISHMPAPKKKQKGKVIEVVEKGYYLNDKILRHAKVVVGS